MGGSPELAEAVAAAVQEDGAGRRGHHGLSGLEAPEHWHGEFFEEVQLVDRLKTLLHCDYFSDPGTAVGMTYDLTRSLGGQIIVDRGFLLASDIGGGTHRVKALKIVGFEESSWIRWLRSCARCGPISCARRPRAAPVGAPSSDRGTDPVRRGRSDPVAEQGEGQRVGRFLRRRSPYLRPPRQGRRRESHDQRVQAGRPRQRHRALLVPARQGLGTGLGLRDRPGPGRRRSGDHPGPVAAEPPEGRQTAPRGPRRGEPGGSANRGGGSRPGQHHHPGRRGSRRAMS